EGERVYRMAVYDRFGDLELDRPALLADQFECAGVEVDDGAEGDRQAGDHRALSGAIVDHQARHRCERRRLDAPEEDIGRIRVVWLGEERQEAVPGRREPFVVTHEESRPAYGGPLQVEGLIREAQFVEPVGGVGQTA